MTTSINGAPLWRWINERHAIYLRRQAAPNAPPWSNDPIFQKYRFCNVFRELDTVTIWIREHIREPLADHPLLWFWLAAARNINWPDTLQSIQDFAQQAGWPDEFHSLGIQDIMSYRAEHGMKNFGSAYVITNGGRPIPKEEYVCQHVLQPLWQMTKPPPVTPFSGQSAAPPTTLESVWNWFLQFEGFGPFIAYEVVTDLRHTRYLSNAKDIYSWANAGPGAKRGLNRLLGRPAAAPMPSKEALSWMRTLCGYANQPAGGDVLGEHVPRPLEMRDIEHSLCETDKYLRAATGEGRPKQQFKPGAVYGHST